MVCSRICIHRNRLVQCRIICEWLNLTITMLICIMELSHAIQDVPRLYNMNTSNVEITEESVSIFRRLLCYKVRQLQRLVELVEVGCQFCTRTQAPPQDPSA